MFQNLHLSNIVNQPGGAQQQQQQQLNQQNNNERTIVSSVSQACSPTFKQKKSLNQQSPGLPPNSRASPKKTAMIGALPRQQQNENGKSPDRSSMNNNHGALNTNEISFMAVGSRLSMSTYAKKETANPVSQPIPGVPTNTQKVIKARHHQQQSQQNYKQQHIKGTVLSSNSKPNKTSLPPSSHPQQSHHQNANRHQNNQSLNSDLFPVGRHRAATQGSRPNRGASNSRLFQRPQHHCNNVGKHQVTTGSSPRNPAADAQDDSQQQPQQSFLGVIGSMMKDSETSPMQSRSYSLYKGKGAGANQGDGADLSPGGRLPHTMISEANDETTNYVQMNIEVKTTDGPLEISQISRQSHHLDDQGMMNIETPNADLTPVERETTNLVQDFNPEDFGLQVGQTQPFAQKKTSLTTVIQTIDKTGILDSLQNANNGLKIMKNTTNQLHEQSSIGCDESRENFATSSVVTQQQYHGTTTQEDYQGQQVVTQPVSQQSRATSGARRQNQQQQFLNYGSAGGAGGHISQPGFKFVTQTHASVDQRHSCVVTSGGKVSDVETIGTNGMLPHHNPQYASLVNSMHLKNLGRVGTASGAMIGVDSGVLVAAGQLIREDTDVDLAKLNKEGQQRCKSSLNTTTNNNNGQQANRVKGKSNNNIEVDLNNRKLNLENNSQATTVLQVVGQTRNGQQNSVTRINGGRSAAVKLTSPHTTKLDSLSARDHYDKNLQQRNDHGSIVQQQAAPSVGGRRQVCSVQSKQRPAKEFNRTRTGPLPIQTEQEHYNHNPHLHHYQNPTPLSNNAGVEMNSQNQLSTNRSPANFSHIEKRQQQALLGITGNTLSQHLNTQLAATGKDSVNRMMAKQPQLASNKSESAAGAWKGQKVSNYQNGEKVQLVGGVQGLKGRKVPRNSQFMKMQGFLMQKARENQMAHLSGQQIQQHCLQNGLASPMNAADHSSIVLNSERGTIVGLVEQNNSSVVSRRSINKDINLTQANVVGERATKKQSILVQQNRPRTQDGWRDPTVMKTSPQLSQHENMVAGGRVNNNRELMIQSNNSGFEQLGGLQGPMMHRVDLRSQTSSQDQHEQPLPATMVEQIAVNRSNQNTIGLVLEQNAESATLQINSPKKDHEQQQLMQNNSQQISSNQPELFNNNHFIEDGNYTGQHHQQQLQYPKQSVSQIKAGFKKGLQQVIPKTRDQSPLGANVSMSKTAGQNKSVGPIVGQISQDKLDVQTFDFEAIVRRDSAILNDIMVGTEDNLTGKLSTATPDKDFAKCSQLEGFQIEEGGDTENFNIVDIQTKIILNQQAQLQQHEQYLQQMQQGRNPNFSHKQQLSQEVNSHILNFPPPVQLSTICSNKEEPANHLHEEKVEKQRLQRHLSPRLRTLQKKDGNTSRQSKSQHSKKRNQNLLQNQMDAVIGTRFKPKVIFKEHDMQLLFDKAEQPIQQIIEKILIDDIDQFQGFSYASQSGVKKQSQLNHSLQAKNNANLGKNNPSMNRNSLLRSQEHLKYEFIEQLLRKPDLDMTKKTLHEMTALYQDLLEKNLSTSSVVHMERESVLVASQASAILLTEQQSKTLYQNVAEIGSQQTFNLPMGVKTENESILTKKLESQALLKTDRGSLQMEFRELRTAGHSPFAKLGSKTFDLKKMSVKDINDQQTQKERQKMNLNGIMPNKSGGNTLFLELGSKHLSNQNQSADLKIGIVSSKSGNRTNHSQNVTPTQSQNINIKKANILKDHQQNHNIMKVPQAVAPGDQDMMHLNMDIEDLALNMCKQNTLEVGDIGTSLASPGVVIGDDDELLEHQGTLLNHNQWEKSLNDDPVINNSRKYKAGRAKAKVLLSHTHTPDDMQSPRSVSDLDKPTEELSTFDNRPPSQQLTHTLHREVNGDKDGEKPREGSSQLKYVGQSKLTSQINKRQNASNRKKRQMQYSSLSPRIEQLDRQIKEKSAKPQLKTNQDVQNASQVLSVAPPGVNLSDADAMSPIIVGNASVIEKTGAMDLNQKDRDALQLQMARSAYLTFRASKMNNGKVIVGNELKDANQRKKFVEQLFNQPGGVKKEEKGASAMQLSSQIMSIYETKTPDLILSGQTSKTAAKGGQTNTHVGGDYESGNARNNGSKNHQSTAQSKSQSSSQIRLQQKQQNNNMMMTQSQPLMIQEMEVKEHVQIKALQVSTSAKSSTQHLVQNRGEKPRTPLASTNVAADWNYNQQQAKDQNKNYQSATDTVTNLHQQNNNTNSNKNNSSNNTAQGSTKNNNVKQTNSTPAANIEKKNVIQHELKVPGAGQLENVKTSRLRQLSSNQVTGFRIRTGQYTNLTSQDQDDANFASQPQYGLEPIIHTKQAKKGQSNKDLAGLIKPRTKSNFNVSHSTQRERNELLLQQEQQLELNSSQEDAEEVGTQMMISRANLGLSSQGAAIPNLQSPKTAKALEFTKVNIVLDVDTAPVDQSTRQQAQTTSKNNTTAAEKATNKENDNTSKANYGSIVYNSKTRQNHHHQHQVVEFSSTGTAFYKAHPSRKHHGSSHTVSHVSSQKLGTIKVKELYNQNAESSSLVAKARAVSNSRPSDYMSQAAFSPGNNSSGNTNQRQKIKEKATLMRIHQGRHLQKKSQELPSRIMDQKKSLSQTANFERLSGLITQSNSTDTKARLIAHYKKLKEIKRIDKANEDWRRATPVISKGSTFYKDLFDLRSKVGTAEEQDFLDMTLQPGLNQTLLESVYRQQNNMESEDLLNQNEFMQSMIQLNHSQLRPQISSLLSRDLYKQQNQQRKDTFSISKTAVTKSAKHLIGQLLMTFDGNRDKEAQAPTSNMQVSALKQNCLVQFILDEWSSTTKSQLRQFNHFCSFTDCLKVVHHQHASANGGKISQAEITNLMTEAYSVILYGKQTPISNCCKQLICFQFVKVKSAVDLYCLEPGCRKMKLETRPLNQDIFHSIFLTAQHQRNRHPQSTTQILSQIASKARRTSTSHGDQRRGFSQSVGANAPFLVSSKQAKEGNSSNGNSRKRILLQSQQQQSQSQQRGRSQQVKNRRTIATMDKNHDINHVNTEVLQLRLNKQSDFLPPHQQQPISSAGISPPLAEETHLSGGKYQSVVSSNYNEEPVHSDAVGPGGADGQQHSVIHVSMLLNKRENVTGSTDANFYDSLHAPSSTKGANAVGPIQFSKLFTRQQTLLAPSSQLPMSSPTHYSAEKSSFCGSEISPQIIQGSKEVYQSSIREENQQQETIAELPKSVEHNS